MELQVQIPVNLKVLFLPLSSHLSIGVYNTGKFAISAAFTPIGGGGGATFEKGLPSLEYDPSLIAASLAPYGVTGYELEANFEASSIYFGYQANIAYKINDMLSVAVGGRFVTASNTYNGYLRNVNLNYNGTMTGVGAVFTDLPQATAGATQATGAATQVQGIIDAGYGGSTLPESGYTVLLLINLQLTLLLEV